MVQDHKQGTEWKLPKNCQVVCVRVWVCSLFLCMIWCFEFWDFAFAQRNHLKGRGVQLGTDDLAVAICYTCVLCFDVGANKWVQLRQICAKPEQPQAQRCCDPHCLDQPETGRDLGDGWQGGNGLHESSMCVCVFVWVYGCGCLCVCVWVCVGVCRCVYIFLVGLYIF